MGNRGPREYTIYRTFIQADNGLNVAYGTYHTHLDTIHIHKIHSYSRHWKIQIHDLALDIPVPMSSRSHCYTLLLLSSANLQDAYSNILTQVVMDLALHTLSILTITSKIIHYVLVNVTVNLYVFP